MTASPNVTKELLDKICASVTRWNPSDPTYDEALDALRAYGDQREREALERAAKAIRAQQPIERGRPTERDIGYSGGLFTAENTLAELGAALIPKGPAND